MKQIPLAKRLFASVLAVLLLSPALFSCAKDEECCTFIIPEEDAGSALAYSDPAEAAEIRSAMKYVVHAAGALTGPDAWGNPREYLGSNSLEGLAQCAEAGARVVEIDFNFTSDGQLACIHDWYTEYSDDIVNGVPLSLDEFRATKIYRSFTPAWIGDVAAFLRENEDAYIVTDIKDDNIAGAKAIAEFCPELKNRFLVQIYDASDYDAVRALGFEYIIYTLYRLDWNSKTDWKALGEFAASHPLIGFTFSYELCSVDGYVEGMLRSGVPLYIHTVNEGEEAYFSEGITGVYTDYIR